MKITVFSDVHGNLPALELLFKREVGTDQFIFLGDAVNYGPWSNECVEMLAGIDNIICLKGNHEEDFLKGAYSGVNKIAQSFFKFCYPEFTRFDTIRHYKPNWQKGNFTFVHTIDNKNIYPDTLVDLQDNYFIGHSHHQFKLENNGYKLYNTGSVGQNRKYINVISYLNWFTEKNLVEMVNFIYDVDILINEMKKRNYPSECIEYYESKERK